MFPVLGALLEGKLSTLTSQQCEKLMSLIDLARVVAAGFWSPKQTYSITAGMIKSISIEQKFYDRCCSQSPPCPGIVVGGLNKDEECIFFLLAATGQEYAEPASVRSIDAIDADKLRDQCEKISRMLPAGIHISGLYFSEAADLKSQSENHIKKVSTKTGLFFKLLKILRDCDKHNPFGSSHPDVEKAYLQVEPKTRKITAKVLGFTPTKDFFRPVDVKVKPTIDRWRAIKTHITLSIETHLPSERQRETIMEQLKKAADPYLHAINSETRLLVNNALRGPEEPLFSVKSRDSNRPGSQTKSRTQKRHTLPKEKFPNGRQESCPTTLWEPLDFTLFGPDFPCWHRTSSCSSIDSGASSEAFSADSGCPLVPSEAKKNLLIQGRIPGIAFLPVNGTLVEHALQAFRDDLTHSILMRLELLSEELNVTSGEMEVPQIQLPQRVLIRIPACPAIPMSDYKFVSETPDDVVRRVSMFCRPLGSPFNRDIPYGDHLEGSGILSRGNSSPDSGAELSSDAEINSGDAEPVFNTSCLDTNLERSCEGRPLEDELSDVEIIQDIHEMAQSVSNSKNVILLTTGALVTLLLGILLAIYFGL
ncbi:hypothetical protein SprV_0100301300 [Sparganum proliferum]